MPAPKNTPVILALLRRHRRLTRAAICDLTGLSDSTVAAAMVRLLKPCQRPAGPRRCRIADWTEVHACDRTYLRPVYGMGSSPDARKPSMKRRRRRQHRESWHRRRGVPAQTPVAMPPAPYSIFTAHIQ